MTETDAYDVVIIGAGPAGLAAGLYAARDGFKTLLLEKNGLPGGQIMLTEHIENYPGYEKIGGFELVEKMKSQTMSFGAEIVVNKAVTAIVEGSDGLFEIETSSGETSYRSRAVTAVEDAVYLASRFAAKTTLIHRRREFRAQQVLVKELHAAAKEHNIDILLPFVPVEIVPSNDGAEIDHVKIRNVETGEVQQLRVDGVFVFAGMVPNTQWLADIIKLDEAGYIPADASTMKTPTRGIFVAGDCRAGASMQLATACSDGIVAAMGLRDFFRDPTSWTTQTTQEIKGY